MVSSYAVQVPSNKKIQARKPTAKRTSVAILAVTIPPRHVAWHTSPGHDTRVLSGRARRIALLYAATAHEREARDAMADTPVTHSTQNNEDRKNVHNTYNLSKPALRVVIPSVGNLMEGKSCMFNEISSMTILVPAVYQKYSLVTF